MGRLRDSGNKSFGAVRIGDHANLLDEETITIGDPENGGKTFEWDDDAAVTEGNVLVDIGADAEEAIDNLKAAINEHLAGKILAYDDPVETETLRLEGAEAGALGNLAFETDMADSGNIIAATSDLLTGGTNDENRARTGLTYIVTALDVAAENAMIPTPFASPVLGAWRVATVTTDVPKYITDIVKVVGTRVQISKNGATNLAAGDKVYVEVFSAD